MTIYSLARSGRASIAPSAIGALGILMLAAAFSFLDRQLLTLLVVPIQADLHISDTQVGTLQGLSFALLFSLVAMPIGWLVDRSHRWRILCVGVIVWSCATVSAGFARDFNDLLLARLLIGIGEATLMPCAYSLLADYFPASQRGRAYATFLLAIYIGSGGGLLVGGAALRALGEAGPVDLGPLDWRPLWQATFILIGAPGLLLAGLMLIMREPDKSRLGRRKDIGKPEESHGLLHYIAGNRFLFFNVWMVYALLTLAAFAILPWGPTFIVRTFHLRNSTAGMLLGTASIIGSLSGAITAGVIGDRWTRTGKTGAKYRLAFAWWITCPPMLLLITLSGQIVIVVLAFVGLFFSLALSYASASAAVQDIVPPELRGRAVAFWYLVTGLIGNSGGPYATGWLTDNVFHDEKAVGYSMLSVALPAVAIGALLSSISLKTYDRLRRALLREPKAPLRLTPASGQTV